MSLPSCGGRSGQALVESNQALLEPRGGIRRLGSRWYPLREKSRAGSQLGARCKHLSRGTVAALASRLHRPANSIKRTSLGHQAPTSLVGGQVARQLPMRALPPWSDLWSVQRRVDPTRFPRRPKRPRTREVPARGLEARRSHIVCIRFWNPRFARSSATSGRSHRKSAGTCCAAGTRNQTRPPKPAASSKLEASQAAPQPARRPLSCLLGAPAYQLPRSLAAGTTPSQTPG
jgi:hypothetical protein